MRMYQKPGALLAAALIAALPIQTATAAAVPSVSSTRAATGQNIIDVAQKRVVKKTVVVRKNVTRNVYVKRSPRVVKVYRPYYRPWHRQPHFGSVVAGVTLGTLIAATVANAIPPRPADNVCWYWSNPYHTSGYWDYCY